MRCPNCDSENTQTFQMAHAGGIHSGTARGTVYGTGGDFHWQSAQVETSSQLARETAPPAKPRFFTKIMWLGIPVGILLYLALAIVLQMLLPVYLQIMTTMNGSDLSDQQRLKYLIYYSFVRVLLFPVMIVAGFIVMGFVRKPRYGREKLLHLSRTGEWVRSMICLRCGHRWLK